MGSLIVILAVILVSWSLMDLEQGDLFTGFILPIVLVVSIIALLLRLVRGSGVEVNLDRGDIGHSNDQDGSDGNGGGNGGGD